jgi:hypothetical protein
VSNKDVKQDALDNLADALTEDILNTPDDELLREVEEDYGDPHALANKFDQILERAEKQAFGVARTAASPQTQSSFRAQSSVLYYSERMLDWLSTLFGNRMVLAWAVAALIALILVPAVFLSISEFNERSRQLAAQEKEQLARSEQLAAQDKEQLARSERLAAQEKELLARSEQLAAQEKDLLARSEQLAAREEELRPQAQAQASTAPGDAAEAPQAQAHATESGPSILCETYITEPGGYKRPIIEQPPSLICLDDELAFWQNLAKEIYFHKWQRLDANGRNIFRQGQLDWLRNMTVNCNAEVPVSGTEMARAKSCILQSTKERVSVLSNN